MEVPSNKQLQVSVSFELSFLPTVEIWSEYDVYAALPLFSMESSPLPLTSSTASPELNVIPLACSRTIEKAFTNVGGLPTKENIW